MDTMLHLRTKTVSDEPVVCFVWHWPCVMVPEAQTVWHWYEQDFDDVVQRFRAQGFQVFSHEHPKWRGEMNKRMLDHDVRVFPNDIDVFKMADVMIVDNSSLAFEFMLLDRSVVFMNAPWYRKDVEHGGRFWEWARGHPQVDSAEELMSLNLWDIVSPLNNIHSIQETANQVYAHTDGTSSQRAADWIVDLLNGAL
jgi:CDP-glycerol glycerophosphotransferase (TagB/SpsB family)